MMPLAHERCLDGMNPSQNLQAGSFTTNALSTNNLPNGPQRVLSIHQDTVKSVLLASRNPVPNVFPSSQVQSAMTYRTFANNRDGIPDWNFPGIGICPDKNQTVMHHEQQHSQVGEQAGLYIKPYEESTKKNAASPLDTMHTLEYYLKNRTPDYEAKPQIQIKSTSLLMKEYTERKVAAEIASAIEGRSFPEDATNEIDVFSTKVFVGGLPMEMQEDEIIDQFSRFGSLIVHLPFKVNSTDQRYRYVFLIFERGLSVQKLLDACCKESGKFYAQVYARAFKYLTVQIRPWKISDSVYVVDPSIPIDLRRMVFVRRVPHALKAVELSVIINNFYLGVCYSRIELDDKNNFPKGFGYVCFNNRESYVAAISARFLLLRHSGTNKRLEIKPYVFASQICDVCYGQSCEEKFATFFCQSISCLRYFCKQCWVNFHSLHCGDARDIVQNS